MATPLNTFLTGPSPGATHVAGPPTGGHTVSVSSLNDCLTSNCAEQRSQR
ncbi:MAG: hypothetical protein OXC06_08115 [Acidimicrobiaceae bacterium]|nr:hypothetical protein [Acidimicrobiaceae bacterium]